MKKTIITLALTLFAVIGAMAQHNVSGKITDDIGEVLPGVTITLKGSAIGVMSDIDGNYTITIPAHISPKNAILIYSYLGYKKQEIKVDGRTTINITLQEINNNLEEVVIMSQGKHKDSHKPSSTSSMPVGKIAGGGRRRDEAKEIGAYHQISGDKASPALYGSSAGIIINQPIQQNTEEYGSFIDNKFIYPLDEALSTFSIDVDAASYANMRRYINNGQIPAKDVIRTEELINYFNYSYPQPTGNHPINTITEIAECPWNNENKLVHIGIKAKEIPLNELPAAHLIFLIDVSGSMSSHNRMPYVKQSFKMLVKQLRDKDKISIITYANGVNTVLTAVSGSDKTLLNNTIDALYASGGTSGGAAIQNAYKLAKSNFIKNGNNRIILATDGDFNIGLSSNSELEQLIEKERDGGIFLTVLGYGMGNYKDQRLQTLAQKGNGNHAYIDNITEAEKVLVNEFGGTMFTIAKDVKIQVEFNPSKVQAYRLIGYESRMLNKEDFNDDTKDAGEIGVGHSVTALYEIIPVGVKSKLLTSVDKLKYQKNEPKDKASLTNSPEMFTLKVRYKPTDSETSKKIEISVLDSNKAIKETSDNFRFSAAVAQVGMILHESPYKSEANYKSAITLAEGAYGNDKDGNRHEFVKLIKSLHQLSETK